MNTGTRVRAGNAMQRTRAAILDAAIRCVAERGARKTTMGDIAKAASIAKGTLYNHFRTKDEVLAAAADARAAELLDAAGELAPETALVRAAETIATDSAVRRVAVEEPELAATLVAAAEDYVPSVRDALGWGDDVAGVAVRWVASHVFAPGDTSSRAAGADAVGRLIADRTGRLF